MSCLFRFLTVASLFAVPGCAEGHEINRMAGVDIALGEFSGVLPLPFSATLAPGQSVVFSIPGKIGEPERRLEVARVSDRVFLSEGRSAE